MKESSKNNNSKYIINPLTNEELNQFLDHESREIIKYFIIKSLFSQPEPKLNQNTLPIQIPKEHIEQWFTQALNVNSVGAGSHPIDIYNPEQKWGADIKMLNIKISKSGNVLNRDSGEASLGQKFTGTGNELDSLFKDKKYNSIKNGWLNLYVEKYKSIKNKYDMDKIFYFFILRPGSQKDGAYFYFAGAVIDLDNIKNVKVNKTRTTDKSVYIQNFISDKFGNTKIYKSKRRLELRLYPKEWVDSKFALKISTTFNHKHINLREQYNKDYMNKKLEEINNIQVEFID